MLVQHISAKVKLQLLLKGVRITERALEGLGLYYKEYQYGYNDSNWISRTSKPLIPSELLLPGGIVSAPHLRPNSPFLIDKEGERMFIIDERKNEMISEVEYLPRPKIWDIELSDGSKVKEYLNVYGTNCLNLFIVANCEFWTEGIPCVFCSLQPTQNQHKEVVIYKKLEKIGEALNLVFSNEKNLDWMIITGGSLKNRVREVDRYCEVLNVIRKYIPHSWNGKIKGNAALLPSNNEEDLERLFQTGIEHPSFNLEVFGRKLFETYCSGKEKYASFDSLIEAYKKAVKIWGEGEVWCNFVGGISPLDDLKQGFKFMADQGVVPGANIFHLDPKAVGVKLNLKEPSEDYVLEMYSCLSELYKEYGYKPFFSESVLRNSLANEMYKGWL